MLTLSLVVPPKMESQWTLLSRLHYVRLLMKTSKRKMESSKCHRHSNC